MAQLVCTLPPLEAVTWNSLLEKWRNTTSGSYQIIARQHSSSGSMELYGVRGWWSKESNSLRIDVSVGERKFGSLLVGKFKVIDVDHIAERVSMYPFRGWIAPQNAGDGPSAPTLATIQYLTWDPSNNAFVPAPRNKIESNSSVVFNWRDEKSSPDIEKLVVDRKSLYPQSYIRAFENYVGKIEYQYKVTADVPKPGTFLEIFPKSYRVKRQVEHIDSYDFGLLAYVKPIIDSPNRIKKYRNTGTTTSEQETNRGNAEHE